MRIAAALRALLAIALMLLAAPLFAQDGAATIAAGDTVTVTIDGDTRVSGHYVVGDDGGMVLPLVGRVQASGATAPTVASRIATALAAYMQQPKVQVVFRPPQRVFIFGDVKRPGTFELTPDMTVLELLLQAQYSGVSEVFVVRTGNARVPVLPDQAAPAAVIHVNLRDFEADLATGDLSKNLVLRAGDTVFVPSVDPNTVNVSGAVNKPGGYSVPRGTTVLQLLTLAGGVTEDAAIGRLRVLRVQNGRPTQTRGSVTQEVLPGDTIVVPETQLHPTLRIGASDESAVPGVASSETSFGDVAKLTRTPELSNPVRIGTLTLQPVLSLTGIGVDSNVFNSHTDPKSDTFVSLTPKLGATMDLGRLRLNGVAGGGVRYYRTYASERSIDPVYGASAELDLGSRTHLAVGGGYQSTHDRFNFELDERIRREERGTSASVHFGPFGRIGVVIGGEQHQRRLPGLESPEGVKLATTLNEDVQTLTGSLEFVLSPDSTMTVSVAPSRYRFPLFAAKNADGREVRFDGSFKAGTLLRGGGRLAYAEYEPHDPAVRRFRGVQPSGDLSHVWGERTETGVRGERKIAAAFESNVAFSILDQYGLWVRQQLSRRFDLFVAADRLRYTHQAFAFVDVESAVPPRTDGRRYTAQLGTLVGHSRVALEVVEEERAGSAPFSNLRWNVVFSLIRVGK